MGALVGLPTDLLKEPWWPAAAAMRLDAVLDRVSQLDEMAAVTLAHDMLDTFRVSARASDHVVNALLRRESLAAWAMRWRPAPQRVLNGQMERLRQALAALCKALGGADVPPAGQALPPELEPLAGLDVRVLSERRQMLRVEVPGVVYGALPTWGPALPLSEFWKSPPGRDAAVRAWLVRVGRELAQSLQEDAPARAERHARYRERATGPLGEALLGLHDRVAAGQVPVTAPLLERTAIAWNPLSATVTVESHALLACLQGTCLAATLSLAGDTPGVSCRTGAGPCRQKALAVERVLALLVDERQSEDHPDGAAALRDFLRQPAWKRTLTRLGVAAERAGQGDDGRLGWVLKGADELALHRVSPKKAGGLKAKALTQGELDTIELEDTRDVLALGLVRTRGSHHFESSFEREERVAKALVALIGHERFHLKVDKEIVPARILRVTPEIAVVPSADGPRIVVRWGERDLALARPPSPGRWALDVDFGAGVVRVGLWTRAAHEAWLALRDAPPIPDEATPALASALLDLSTRVPVKKDTTWLGDAHAPAPDVVFRLGLGGPRGAKVLLVEGRAQPVPELGALLPGDGEAIVPLRRDGRVAHVVRDLERERAAVLAYARAAGLVVDEGAAGPALFEWSVEGIEQAAPIWIALDALAREPDSALRLVWGSTPPRVVRAARADKLALRVGLRKDWLDIAGGVSLDGGELPLRELLDALRDHKRFVALDDTRVVELGEQLVQELAPLTALARARDREVESLRASVLAAPLLAELEAAGATVAGPPEWLTAQQRVVEAAGLAVPLPAGLEATLRPYQHDGFLWLARLAHWAHGACLADDMGLGKTLQALALVLHRRALGRALVVTPTSVVANWRREAARFSPGLTVAVVARGADIGRLEAGAELIVTSWDLLVRHEERFATVDWATVVYDEAHAVKNAATRRAKAARDLPARFVLALTGTPVENRPSELWSLFQIVAPGLLGSAESFRDTFARPIETGMADATRRLGRLVRPFLLRRRKSEVATELPPRSEVRVDVVLSGDERERYEKVRRSALAELAKEGPVALASGRGILRVLVVLTRLRQLACHGRLVEPSAPATSSKIDRLVDLVDELRAEGRKVLVFSQFTELLGLARVALDEAGVSYTYLDGSTPAEQRVREVDRFQAGQVDAFLLSLKAGGVGLNLTAATEVIHLDPWWNPAVEDQATDRAHRIGQDRPVTVYRLVALGTIEEQILGLHGDKRRMVASLLEGTGSAQPITAEELVALLSEDDLEAGAPDPGAPELAALPAPGPNAPALPAVGPNAPALPAVGPNAPEPIATSIVVAPEPAPPAPARAVPPLLRVLDFLEGARGVAFKRAEIVQGAGLSEGEWLAVRALLEAHVNVRVDGATRGRTYRWVPGAG